MIKGQSIKFTVRTSQALQFHTRPSWVIVRMFYGWLKRLLCVRKTYRCVSCPNKSKCLYAYMTGDDFTNGLVASVLRCQLIEKHDYDKDEDICLPFFLLGESQSYIDFFEIFAEHLTTTGIFKERVAVYAHVGINNSNDLVLLGDQIRLYTPISSPNQQVITTNFFKRLNDLNGKFNLFEKSVVDVKFIENMNLVKYSSSDYIKIADHIWEFGGYLGTIAVRNNSLGVNINSALAVLGLSDLYYQGAGRVSEF